MTRNGEEPILMGDSILKRVLNSYPDLFNECSSDFTVSGQKISDLKVLVKRLREKVKDAFVVLLIGTNNVLKGTPLNDMKIQFRSLLQLFRRLNARVFVVELPPIAKFGLNSERNSVVKSFNAYLRSCCKNRVSSIALFDDFVVNGEIKQDLYCSVYVGTKRVDRIHPNSKGLQIIYDNIIGFILALKV